VPADSLRLAVPSAAMQSPARTQTLTVPKEFDGARLDVALAQLVPRLSRRRLQEHVKAGCVRVADIEVTRPNTAVAAGAVIVLTYPGAEDAPDAESMGSLTVLYEDEHLIAIDKPAGLVTHAAEAHPSGTLADIAQVQFGPLPEVQGENRPGIVHRLDRWTSGVMLLGRTPAVLEALKKQFQERKVQKTYLAIAHGTPRFQSEWIESRLKQDPANRGRFIISRDEDQGRDASTFYEVRERFHGYVFLTAKPKTGRTHQIRVHLLSVGLPIVSDKTYAHRGTHRIPMPPEAPAPERQALHAHRLELDHPVTGAPLVIESPMPEDMATLLAWFREHMPERE